MQRLEVSCAVRPIYGSLGTKGLISDSSSPIASNFWRNRAFQYAHFLYTGRDWATATHGRDQLVVITKVEENIDIKEQEIPVAVARPPVKTEHDYHSNMLHTPNASQSTLHYLSTS
jgi:hypothetical protein